MSGKMGFYLQKFILYSDFYLSVFYLSLNKQREVEKCVSVFSESFERILSLEFT